MYRYIDNQNMCIRTYEIEFDKEKNDWLINVRNKSNVDILNIGAALKEKFDRLELEGSTFYFRDFMDNTYPKEIFKYLNEYIKGTIGSLAVNDVNCKFIMLYKNIYDTDLSKIDSRIVISNSGYFLKDARESYESLRKNTAELIEVVTKETSSRDDIFSIDEILERKAKLKNELDGLTERSNQIFTEQINNIKCLPAELKENLIKMVCSI